MIEKMMELQKEFKELYDNGPLVAVTDGYIHVDSKYILEQFPIIRKAVHSDGWYELSAIHNGVQFIALERKGDWSL